MQEKRSPSIAIIPGRFDPITYGHLDLVERASEQYDKVYLAVMINREKQYLLSIEQRKAIAEVAINQLNLSNVEVIASEGMLWKLAYDLGACAIVKGYRNATDLAYEEKMAEYNRQHNPNAETVLLEARSDLLNVSSTLVREKIAERESLSEWMPLEAEQMLYQFLSSETCSK